jgi:hypothetical protein
MWVLQTALAAFAYMLAFRTLPESWCCEFEAFPCEGPIMFSNREKRCACKTKNIAALYRPLGACTLIFKHFGEGRKFWKFQSRRTTRQAKTRTGPGMTVNSKIIARFSDAFACLFVRIAMPKESAPSSGNPCSAFAVPLHRKSMIVALAAHPVYFRHTAWSTV